MIGSGFLLSVSWDLHREIRPLLCLLSTSSMALVRPNNGVKVEIVKGSPVLEAEGVYAQLKKDEEAAGGKKEPVTIERASKPCFIIQNLSVAESLD